MYPGDEAVVVATVTVVFDPATDATTPHEIATALIADERVSTVRVGDFGAPSVYRVDVPAGDPERHDARRCPRSSGSPTTWA